MSQKKSFKVARTAICFSVTVKTAIQDDIDDVIDEILDDVDVEAEGHLDWLIWHTKKKNVCLGVLFAPLTVKNVLKEFDEQDKDVSISMLSVARIMKTETMKDINSSIKGIFDTDSAKIQIRNWNVGSDDEVKNPINDLDRENEVVVEVEPKKKNESWQSYTDKLVDRVRLETAGLQHLTQNRLK